MIDSTTASVTRLGDFLHFNSWNFFNFLFSFENSFQARRAARITPPPTKLSCMRVVGSVTRLGDLLNFGELFKAYGNN